jgi:hypothetical protein
VVVTPSPTPVPTEVAGVVATPSPTDTPTATPVETEVAGVVATPPTPPRPAALPATGGLDPYVAAAVSLLVVALGLVTLRFAARR